jgi:hypothetical protein
LLAQGADPYSDTFNGKGYNGITTIKSKTNLAFDQGGGIMMWELSGDVSGQYSLVSAIHEVVINRNGGGPVIPKAPIGKTIWLQGNNALYVSSENGTKAMNCNRTTPQDWEQFYVGDAGNGKVTLQSMGKYVSSENGAQAMTCNRATPQGWEQFDWLVNADSTISLRGNNGLYVSSENGTAAMNCNRTSIQDWEKFKYGIVTATFTRVATTAFDIVTGNTPGGIYPNPVQKGSALTVSVKQYNANAPVHVTLMDISGKTLAQYKISTGNLNIPVKYMPGTYLVKIENAGNSYIQKLIVQ